MSIYINRQEIKKKLEKKLSTDECEQAKGDFHAWREKCVTMLPIISGKDCPFGCTYCYIQSMGFQFKEPEPLKISGEQICYAFMENKEFIAGRYGTPVAFGHISEPFLPQLLDNTLEYIKAISTYLGNPIQFSTKEAITPDLAKKIKTAAGGTSKSSTGGSAGGGRSIISPLVTITTLNHYKKLEPNAPPPEKRFKSITNLTKAGFQVFLYLRPLVPGIVDAEIEEILKTAKNAGAVGVVGGGLRITLPILNQMKASGIDISEIAKRVPNIDEKQRYIYTKDLEDKVIQIARNVGLVPLRSTKCALAYVGEVPAPSLYWIYNKDICTKCKQCAEQIPKFKESEIQNILKEVFSSAAGGNEEVLSFQDQKDHIQIKLKGAPPSKEVEVSNLWKPRVLETYFRKRVVIQRESPKA